MLVLRLLSQSARLLLSSLWLALGAALFLAMLTDHDAEGALRITVFPLALTLFEPLTWDCVRNSSLVAGVSTLCALLVGVPLGRLFASWKFWGRSPLALMLLAPLILPQTFAALGLRLVAGPDLLSPWSKPDFLWYQPWNWSLGGAWLAWVAIAASAGSAFVALVTAHSLSFADSRWEEAGLASGASKRQVWRTLVWPLIRPRVARAAVLTFGATLLEPGPPLIFGLRACLPYQIVEAASHPALATNGRCRAATLVSLAILLVVVFHLVLRRPSGRPIPTYESEPGRFLQPRFRQASWRKSLWLVPLLTLAVLFLCAPWLSLALSPPASEPLNPGSLRFLTTDPRFSSTLVASLLLGLLSTGLGLLLACSLHLRSASKVEPATSRFVTNLAIIPPLALALIFTLLPGTLGDLASLLGVPYLPLAFARLSHLLDPLQNSGISLILALACLRLPMLFWGVERLSTRYHSRWVDAAEVLGAARVRAIWDLVRPRLLLPLLALVASSFALSATDLAACLLLCPTSRSSPVTLTVLNLADEPLAQSLACSLAIFTSLACLLFFLLAASFWIDLFRPRAEA